MESVRRAVKQIAHTPPSQWLSTLSPYHLSLTPLLFLASSLYSVAIRLRRQLHRLNIFEEHRLPVPVISVGNLTWGGNGKTPMVEFLARSFAGDGVSPLVLTRGYGGADEARMLQRQLKGTSSKVGVGANRVAIATKFLEQYGYMNFHGTYDKLFSGEKMEVQSNSDRVGVAILDDGMQHLSVMRDLEIVMVNALMPWGNHLLIPLGALREPLTALSRADILVIHHVNLVPENAIETLESTIQSVKKALPIFFTRMTPVHFSPCRNISCKIPLKAVENMVVLCLSGIGCADSFIQSIERMGAAYVDHLDFSDHHLFQLNEIKMVLARLEALEAEFASNPVVIVTEKDYDRAPKVLEHMSRYQVLVLCSRLEFVARKGSTEDGFKKAVRELLGQRVLSVNKR
ncbi:Probable tetraacyldisaccharide 4-kinase-mitochondrial [Striga hermonthica]|uniref:tetraacyldisaccharide 4'-kinase n=1 Tax=Striga hermonthica TaxID=68872 RepID=A0A9N7MSL3_STRHE|nr:Probable tetraacyldisaccharide 4-kinase-mitochondrial [Striga hermonthica]